MRFRSLHNRRPAARASSAASPVPPPTPHPPPPPRAVHWRSLWGRVYARWATTPAATTPAMRPSFPATDPTPNGTLPSKESPLSAAPHAGLRAYLQRKRGELWFLTKRRHDGDLQSADEADEVEVPPPHLHQAGSGENVSSVTTRIHPLRSLLSLSVEQPSSASSELEIDMSSYSASSDGLDEQDEDDDDVVSDRVSNSSSEGDGDADDDGDKSARDSYATAQSASDPFLRRYSSWCSIDDEQAANARAHDASETHAQDESRSPTLEELYEVRYVDVGGTPTPIAGIWV